jgi:uncharacterized RDD family membrane protein YckC
MGQEFWIYVLGGVATIAIPVLLYVELYIGHMDYTGFLQKCGFGRREVGLLLVGGLGGIILGPLGLYGVPLFIYQSSLLAIDFGGAIIPIVLSIYLIITKKLNLPTLITSIAVISVVAYLVSEFRPPLGIVSEFPYFLFPSFTAIGLALLVYRQRITSGIPFAYATTTFGVLIGADIVRIPLVMVGLEQVRESYGLPFAAGSIGGAGGMDLVFLAGLIAAAPLFFLAPLALRRSKEEITPSKAFDNKLHQTMTLTERLLKEGKYDAATETALRAVDMKIQDVGYKFGIKQSSYITLDMLKIHPYLRNDYWLLVNASRQKPKSPNEAFRAIITARHLIRELDKVENRLYATYSQRIVAFLVDMSIIIGIMLCLFYIGGIMGLYDLNDIFGLLYSIWFVAFTMWLWVASAFYFTIFEAWKGQSPGKKLIGIKVTNDEQEKCDFMDAFTRNVVRLFDMVLLFYAASLIVMKIYPNRQRIGDKVAKTMVIKV